MSDKDDPSGKPRLIKALVQSAQESPVFFRHITDILQRCVESDDFFKKYISKISQDTSHAEKVDAFKKALDEVSPPQGIIEFIEDFSNRHQDDAHHLSTIVISELVFREAWEKSINDNPDTERFYIGVIKAMGMN